MHPHRRHRQHLIDVRPVLGARRAELGVGVVQIVVAVRQAEARLSEIDDVPGRVLVVLVHLRGKRRVDANPGEVRDRGGDVALALDRIDSGEFGGERPGSQRFQTRLSSMKLR